MAGWGPSHQRPRSWRDQFNPRWFSGWIALVAVGWYLIWPTLPGLIVFGLGGLAIAGAVERGVKALGSSEGGLGARLVAGVDGDRLLAGVVARAREHGGGIYLGQTKTGGWRYSRPQRAVLLLGPPRSGKTSGVIVPGLLSHDGAVVSTSTKPDVLTATAGARSRAGKVWEFDPTGKAWAGVGERLRWSPVFGSRVWDQALLMSRAMVSATGVGTGTTDHSHWARRAQALLAPILHAAALGGREIDAVLDWVMRHELDQPAVLLEQNEASPLAVGMLTGLQNTEARELSSIFSAAADALDAYTTPEALEAARDQNFHPDRFVTTADTIYIHAPAEDQTAAAPLVCGLLRDIRRATYHAHRERQLKARVLFALDEVANIAPLDELPQIASEGGGQGLALLAALQDLSQARQRWGRAADGFLSLFGTKLILPGIADKDTLEAVSVALGEYDRQTVSTTRARGHQPGVAKRSQTIATQRQRVLSPGEIANTPAGKALHLDGVQWELLTLTPAHTDPVWKTLGELPIAAES